MFDEPGFDRMRPRELARLLEPSARAYAGKSSNQAEQLRAQIWAALARVGVPASAIPDLREDLATSSNPLILATAARALNTITAGREWLEIIAAARRRLRGRDARVDLGVSLVKNCCGSAPTADQELAHVWDLLNDGAAPAAPLPATEGFLDGVQWSLNATELSRISVQDQNADTMALGDALAGRTCLVGFFYTRCMNPEKCSLTVSRLAQVSSQLAEAENDHVRVLGISYDPAFDSSEKLRVYGTDRGWHNLSAPALLRVTKGWRRLQTHLRLRVGFGSGTVNQHPRELFMIGSDLTVRPLRRGIIPSSDELDALLTRAAGRLGRL